MLKSIDAQRGSLYNWAGPIEAVVVAVAVADSKVSVGGFFPFVFLEHGESWREQRGEETRAKAATVLQNAASTSISSLVHRARHP